MSTSTASLPMHGNAPAAPASKFLTALFGAPKRVAKPAASRTTMMDLLRLSAGLNSVNPELFIDRIVQD